MKNTLESTLQPVTPYNDEELAFFREIILMKLAEAEQNLEVLKQSMDDNIEGNADDSAYSAHLGDVASIEHDRAANFMLCQRSRKFIRQLLAALDRIDNKTYGICKVTGQPIPKGRLEAVPHTRHSIESKLQPA
ncbi:MAG: TraR/DksA C4-type zinc finger protein [Balneolales bacterium]